ncbi:MAG: YerC/YecD family TrpR-related protein [Clostridia bacterium]
MNRFENPQTERLIRALLSLKDEQECVNLLEDLMTIKEMQDLAQRLEVARLLREKITYNEIAQKTGVSTATISRVNRCLSYGAGGYRMVLERLDKIDD